jgi:hypothetical protein
MDGDFEIFWLFSARMTSSLYFVIYFLLTTFIFLNDLWANGTSFMKCYFIFLLILINNIIMRWIRLHEVTSITFLQERFSKCFSQNSELFFWAKTRKKFKNILEKLTLIHVLLVLLVSLFLLVSLILLIWLI